MIELSYLLDREQPAPSQDFLELLAAYTSGCCPNGSSLGLQRPAAADLEQGTTVEAPSPASLLQGVTMEGDTALHVVAANGDSEVFMNCADLIHRKDRTFLSKQNTKGDTPLHCAVRAGNSQMLSHLADLARSDGMLEDLVRKENCSKETVLHEAVRIGDDQIVKSLLTADPELACFPMDGTT
ncbi:ankyrin-1-like [Panicum virgatum]|uniref:ankyrin-1-like n=1 Tax=Panicum virgatum TaxID=38727 RepID=UPI0019D55A60|nr:ankyrin-1-like [Panicum virgatum]